MADTSKRIVKAECLTCGKWWEAPNAHGVGARHAQAAGHFVIVEVTNIYGYHGGR